MLDFTLYSPERVGVSSKSICELLERFSDGRVHSFMMLRHGKCITESYFEPYRADYTHTMNSLSKSFTSLACCFAMADGYLSPDDYISRFFPDKALSDGMKKVKLRHLLTMSAGVPTSADVLMCGPDWAQNYLAFEPETEPGTNFVYSTVTTYMISVIVSRATGRMLDDYLRDKLLIPLEIEGVYWDKCPAGYPKGGVGFHVKTRDIAKLGTFLLSGGAWEGRQLIPREILAEATRAQIPNGVRVEGQPCDWACGYGWQFWRCEPEGVFRGDGAFGQYCIVLPHEDAVIAMTSGAPDMQGLLTDIWNILLPGIKEDALECDPQNEARLRGLEATRKIAAAEGTFELGVLTGERNGSFTLEVGELETTITISRFGMPLKFRVGHGKWITNGAASYSGAWEAPGVYHLREVLNRSPYIRDIKITEADGRIELEASSNVGYEYPSRFWNSPESLMI